MKELSNKEIEAVSGAWASSLSDMIGGGVFGLGYGAITGLAVFTSIGGSGGGLLGFGLIGSAVGAIVGPIAGGIISGIGGFLFGKDAIEKSINDFRDSFIK